MDKSIQLELDNHTAPPYSFLMEKAMAGKILILRLLKSLIMSLIIQSGSLLIIAVCYILSIMKDLPASMINVHSLLIYIQWSNWEKCSKWVK